MATRQSSTENAKPVPSWLNSPAWATKPRAPGRPRPASQNVGKEKVKSKPLWEDENKDNSTINGDEFVDVWEGEPYKRENVTKAQGPLSSSKFTGRGKLSAGLHATDPPPLSSTSSVDAETLPRRTTSLDVRVGQFTAEVCEHRNDEYSSSNIKLLLLVCS